MQFPKERSSAISKILKNKKTLGSSSKCYNQRLDWNIRNVRIRVLWTWMSAADIKSRAQQPTGTPSEDAKDQRDSIYNSSYKNQN